MKLRILAILAIAFLLGATLMSCSQPAEEKPAPAASEPPPAEPPAAATPEPVATPEEKPAAAEKPADKPKEPTKATTSDNPAAKPATSTGAKLKPGLYAHFVTSMGNFTAELNEKEAPITVASFAGLASGEKEYTDPRTGQKSKNPYYDGLIFHRIIGPAKSPPNGFMIQGGDPLGQGIGGPGFTIKDEINNLKHDKTGVVAMARTSAPNSAGSQFYITLGPTPFLDGQQPPYVVFGQVIEGLDVIQKMGSVETDRNDKPLKPVVMTKVTIERVK